MKRARRRSGEARPEYFGRVLTSTERLDNEERLDLYRAKLKAQNERSESHETE